MSTESGLPDFRSQDRGMWNNRNPQELASISALHHNQEEFFQFYQWRMEKLRECQPHEGYYVLARWEKEGLLNSIITQNVDGFHRQAGSQTVAELHGTISSVHCQRCKKSYPNTKYLMSQFTCSCGGVLRPSVVLFGEFLPEKELHFAENEARQADMFIVLGSSLQVSPANYFPMLAKERGARLVIINMEATPFDQMADYVVNNRKIGEVLAEVDRELRNG